MEKRATGYSLLIISLTFVGFAVLTYIAGDASRRTLLKESISLVTLAAFFQMTAQFYTTRSGRKCFLEKSMASILRLHKYVGYTVSAVILIHPLLIVMPRYFEAGISPRDAFITMMTTTTTGILTGITAWVLLVILMTTSIVRYRLTMRYTTWRLVHGILAVLFILFGAWHVIDQGRHITPFAGSLLTFVTAGGIFLFLLTFLPTAKSKQEVAK